MRVIIDAELLVLTSGRVLSTCHFDAVHDGRIGVTVDGVGIGSGLRR